jgi:hypothetical protein
MDGAGDVAEIHGEPGVLAISPDGDQVQCHICGKWYVNLAGHVQQTHGLTADEYKEEFGLNRRTALVGASLSAIRSATAYRTGLGRIGQAHLVPGSHPAARRTEARLRIAEVKRREGRPNALLHAQEVALADLVDATCQDCGATFQVARARATVRRYCDRCRRERRRAADRRRAGNAGKHGHRPGGVAPPDLPRA